MPGKEKTSNSSSGFTVTDFIMPAREKPVSHPPSDPPLCENCRKLELTFFDPNCPGCQDILLEPKTTISEIFAIMRQWVPQVQQNMEMLIREVLRRGAHVDDRDGLTDMTLLHYACKAGAVGVGDVSVASNVIGTLISKGSDVTQKCRWTDMLPLHYASFFDAAPILRVLLKASNARDVDVPCKEFDNGTSLHIAASNLCLEGAKCLLQHGADASLKDRLNRMALHCIPDVDAFEQDSEPAIIAEKMTRLLSEAAEPPMKTIQDQENEVPASLASMGLNIGDEVCIGGNKFGILRFCGPTDFASGEWAGVELSTPVGKNDGSVGGVSYFQCLPKHGIFAPLSKVTKAESLPNSRPSSRPTSASRSQTSSRSSSRPNSRPSSRSNSPASSPRINGTDDSLGFQIGDNVMVAGQKNGTVRFIGRTQFAAGMWLGIELEQPVGKNDGSVADIKYFDCKPSHGVFAPPAKVTKLWNQSHRINHDGFVVPSVPIGKGRSGSQNSLQASGSHSSLSDLSQTDSNPDLNGSARKLSSHSVPDQTSRRGSASSDKNSGTLRRGSLPQQKGKSSAEFQLTEGLSVLVNGELGVVRYIGSAEFAEGIWLGVEMRKPVGKNDGSVNGKKYFHCKPQHGLMVRPSRVTCRGINCAKLINEVES